MNNGCWFCGNSVFEVWHTTYDHDSEEWPMCENCVSAVRYRLALREQGLTKEANIGDQQHGIDTSGVAGKWIDPQKLNKE